MGTNKTRKIVQTHHCCISLQVASGWWWWQTIVSSVNWGREGNYVDGKSFNWKRLQRGMLGIVMNKANEQTHCCYLLFEIGEWHMVAAGDYYLCRLIEGRRWCGWIVIKLNNCREITQECQKEHEQTHCWCIFFMMASGKWWPWALVLYGCPWVATTSL